MSSEEKHTVPEKALAGMSDLQEGSPCGLEEYIGASKARGTAIWLTRYGRNS